MKKMTVWFRIYTCIGLSLVLALCGVCARSIPALRVEMTPRLTDQPGLQVYQDTQRRFGSDLFSVVALERQDGLLLSADGLRVLAELTTAIRGLDGVRRVDSLATVKQIRGGQGFVRVNALFNPDDLDEDRLAQIAADLQRDGLWTGDLLSADGRIAAVNIYAASELRSGRAVNDRALHRLSGQIETVLRGYGPAYHAVQIGRTALEAQANAQVLRRLLIALPLCLLAVSGLLFLYTRHLPGALLMTLSMAVTIGGLLGLMARLGFTLTPAALVGLLTLLALTCARNQRFWFSYCDARLEGRAPLAALRYLLRRDGMPLLISALTLSASPLVLLVSRQPELRQFGLLLAAGGVLTPALSLIVLTGLLPWLPLPSPQRREAQLLRMFGLGSRLVDLHECRRAALVAGMALCVGLAAWGAFRLLPDASQLANSSGDVRLEWLKHHLSGISTVNVTLNAGLPGRATEPDVLRQVDRLHGFLAEQPWCDTQRSLTEYLKILHREMNGGSGDMAAVPSSRTLVSQYLMLLQHVDLSPYLDADAARVNIVVRHHLSSSAGLAAALDALRAYAAAYVSPDLQVDISSYDELGLRAATAQHSALLAAFAPMLGVVLLLLASIFLSVRGAFAGLIPMLASLGLYAGAAGWMGLPLRTETIAAVVLVCAFSLNHIIHFLTRYQECFLATNDQELAVGTTLYHEGEIVVVSSCGLLAGCLPFLLTRVPVLTGSGLFLVLAALAGLVSVMFLMPPVLNAVRIITVWDFIRFDIDRAVMDACALFADLRKGQIKKVLLLGGIQQAAAGEMLLCQGEPGDSLYVLLKGRIEIALNEDGQTQILAASRGPGELVGEMALVGVENERTANVMALEEATLFRLNKRSLERIASVYPRIATRLYANISKILSERLKGMSQ